MSWLPLVFYCTLIYIQSAHPSPEQIPSFPFVDKILHFMAYGLMGILFQRAYQTLKFLGDQNRLLVLLSVVSATLYGISDEIHQSFVPYRHADMADVVADFIGAVCGVGIYYFLSVARRGKRWRELNSEMGIRNAAGCGRSKDK